MLHHQYSVSAPPRNVLTSYYGFGYFPDDAFTEAKANHSDIRLCYFEFGNLEDETYDGKDGSTPVATWLRSHRLIWYREKQQFVLILNHLPRAEGESANVQHRLQKETTDTDNLMLALIGRELDYIKMLTTKTGTVQLHRHVCFDSSTNNEESSYR